jgi:hypothetical protein
MATDPKGVNIPITSTFDSSGTDAAQRELDQVKRDADAAASASSQGFGGQLDGTTRDGAQVEEIRRGTEATVQAQAATSDLTEAEIELAKAKAAVIQGAGEEALKHLEATRATKAHQEGLRQVELATKALIGIQLAKELSSTLQGMKDLVPANSDLASGLDAADSAMTSLTTGMNTFIATGNPYLAVAASLAAGVSGVVSAWQEMTAAQKIATSGYGSVQASMVPLAEQHRQLAISIRQDAIEKQFQAEGAAAVKLMKDLDALAQVKAAQSRLAAAQDRADPNLTPLDRAGNEAVRFSDAKQVEIDALSAKLRSVNEQMVINLKALAEPKDTEAFETAKQRQVDLDVAYADAIRNLVTAAEVNAAELQTKITETQQAASKDFSAGLTEAGNTIKEEIQREVDAAGANASPFAKQALARITALMADNQITPEELTELQSLASQASQSTEAVVNGQVGYFQRLMTWAEASKREWAAFEKRLAALEEKN